jgi:hypothetical protein
VVLAEDGATCEADAPHVAVPAHSIRRAYVAEVVDHGEDRGWLAQDSSLSPFTLFTLFTLFSKNKAQTRRVALTTLTTLTTLIL